MRLAEFALAAGADPKWIQNARMLLDREIPYRPAEARRLGLVREIQAAFGTPLAEADEMAGHALEATTGGQPARNEVVAGTSESGAASVVVDLERYLTDFTVRLSASRTVYEPRRRGRPPLRRRGSALQHAAAYGIDVGLLRDRLRMSRAERLRRLDADSAFILELQGAGDRP